MRTHSESKLTRLHFQRRCLHQAHHAFIRDRHRLHNVALRARLRPPQREHTLGKGLIKLKVRSPYVLHLCGTQQAVKPTPNSVHMRDHLCRAAHPTTIANKCQWREARNVGAARSFATRTLATKKVESRHEEKASTLLGPTNCPQPSILDHLPATAAEPTLPHSHTNRHCSLAPVNHKALPRQRP